MSSSRTPLVSVAMITYNHVAYIADAIEGVLQQEVGFPIELIIGEDCSTDGTREVVFDYRRRYPDIIRVITSEQNVGPRRNGLRVHHSCRGKYVAFCEGDDCWHNPQKLQKQVAILEANPRIGLVHSDCRSMDVSRGQVTTRSHSCLGPKYGPYSEIGNEELYSRILEHRYVLWTCTVCARRALLHQVVESNPEELQSCRFLMGDTPRWLELARITEFAYIDEPLATRNLLAESASRSQDVRRKIRFWRSVRDMCMHYVEKYPCDEATRTRVVDYCNTFLLQLAYFACDRSEAVEALENLCASRISPSLDQRMCCLGTRVLARYLFAKPYFLCARFQHKVRRLLSS